MKRKNLQFLLFASFLLLSGCSKKIDYVEFQQIDPLALSPRVEWLLITDPYVACRKEANYEAEVVTSFRKGEIYRVDGNATLKVDGRIEDWYSVESGWIPGSAVKVYSNKLRAQQALKELR